MGMTCGITPPGDGCPAPPREDLRSGDGRRSSHRSTLSSTQPAPHWLPRTPASATIGRSRASTGPRSPAAGGGSAAGDGSTPRSHRPRARPGAARLAALAADARRHGRGPALLVVAGPQRAAPIPVRPGAVSGLLAAIGYLLGTLAGYGVGALLRRLGREPTSRARRRAWLALGVAGAVVVVAGL